MTRLFHVVCALVLAASIVAFLEGDRRERLTDHPQRDFVSFLEARGGRLSELKEGPNGEFAADLAFPACPMAGRVAWLPVIHRISDVSRREWAGKENVVFVHDRREVASLAAWRVVPRWLWRRIGVNLQVLPEDPWISIAMVLVPPAGCRWPDLDWAALSKQK